MVQAMQAHFSFQLLPNVFEKFNKSPLTGQEGFLPHHEVRMPS